jgi:hypothetical protein
MPDTERRKLPASMPTEERYAALNALLKGKKGEFVLIAYNAKIPTRYGGDGIDHRQVSWYRLGILEEESLRAADGGLMSGQAVTLPVVQYIYGEVEVILDRKDIRRALSVQKGELFQHAFGSPNPPALRTLLFAEQGDHIAIGDEAVREWLRKRAMQGLYKPAADALSKLILEPTE